MPDDFKFPDEAEERKVSAEQDDSAVKEEDDIEVELVDDTPAKDRGRKPLDKEVADPTDDEIENYSDKVQARIKELTHARHDERRVKESLLREKQEMERLMSHLADENKKLKQTVNYGQEVYISTAKDAAEAQLNDARRQYKDAQESYDSDAILAAQEALMDAKTRLDQVKNYRATPLQEDEPPVQREPSQTQAFGPDEKTLRWQAKNQWYGQSGFEEYTSYALGLHHKLVNAGISPRSDEYFAQIEGRMKSTFPELFGEAAAEKPQSETPAISSKRPSSVVAPASRSTGKRTIQLTPTQYALAKKYGLTPQQYAAEVAKLERNNG